MFDSQSSAAVTGLDGVAMVRAGIDRLLAADLAGLGRDELLAAVREVEVQARRLPVVGHGLVAEVEARGVAREVCVPDTATLLRDLLRINIGDARARVRAAADLGPRTGLTGAPLGPLFARTAAAQAAGQISVEHARVITKTVDQLPYAVAAEHDLSVETQLVAQALVFEPGVLARLAQRVSDHLDPDGLLVVDADQQRRRSLSLRANRDGSFTVAGRLTPVCGAIWQTALDAVSAPVPAVDGLRDPRSAGARVHDGFHDLGHLLLCTDLTALDLPTSGRAPVQLVLTMTATQAVTGTGYAHTAHGGLVPAFHALDLTEDVEVTSVLFDPVGGVLSYGRTQRLVPPRMRAAITARDRGCTFPGCTRPPAYCEAHHFREWADGGDTSIQNTGLLLCRFHHREFHRQGWRSLFINKIPYFIPPTWTDPTQTPLRNTAHHGIVVDPQVTDRPVTDPPDLTSETKPEAALTPRASDGNDLDLRK